MLQLSKHLKPGKVIRLFFGKSHLANRTMHVRAIVDKKVVLYKYWANGKWKYDMVTVSVLEEANKEGNLRNGS